MIPRKNLKRALRKAISQPGYASQNFIHRLKSTFSYHFSNGRSHWPESISLFLTYKCNLRCKMCGQWGEHGVFKEYGNDLIKSKLSIQEIESLITNVKHFYPNITLFGGEPTLYPDWLDVIKIIKNAGLRCNIITNGTTIKKWAKEIVDSGIDEIIFSLDGPEKIHDEIRGIKGTFQKTNEGFQLLEETKLQRNVKHPIINVNSTITNNNYKYMDETIAAAKLIHTDILTFHHLLFLERKTVADFIDDFQKQYQQRPTDWCGFISEELPDFKINYLINKIQEIQKQNNKLDVTFYPNFDKDEIKLWYSQYPFHSKSYQNRCKSLWATSYIFPDGSVRPYHTMNYILGNIKENNFTTIWNNNNYIELRQYIKEAKCFSICSKGCTEFFRY